jgi:hypothetical protein
MDGKFIYKSYRNGSSREFEHYKDNLKDVEFFQTSCGTMIRYPFIEGKHFAENAQQFLNVLEQLKKFHSKGLVYGDLRRRNILFHHIHSTLIDFDFLGKKNYVSGFNLKIPDAKRHPLVKEEEITNFSHDLFSFASILEQHDCQDKQWRELILYLKKNTEKNISENESIELINHSQKILNNISLPLKPKPFESSSPSPSSPPSSSLITEDSPSTEKSEKGTGSPNQGKNVQINSNSGSGSSSSSSIPTGKSTNSD